MTNPVLACTLLTCGFTLRTQFRSSSKSVCKQGVRGSSPLGSTNSLYRTAFGQARQKARSLNTDG